MTEPPRQRRLPTKTRSGLITLPSSSQADAPSELAKQLAAQQQQQQAVCDGSGLDEDELEMEMARVASRVLMGAIRPSHDASESSPQGPGTQPEQSTSDQKKTAPSLTWAASAGPCVPVSQGPRIQSSDTTATTPAEVQPAGRQQDNAASGEPPRPGLRPGLKKPASRGVVISTGPLNSSTAPAVVSLPVKRRGSYQTLKKLAGSGELALGKKSTHWERFGTILVLHCAADKTAERDGGILQMMMAEGYDTDVVDCQADALTSFNSKEVYPDMVLVDADHTYNTIQLIKQLQTQHPTVAIIVIGGPRTRPGSVTALQAGAADYVKKPVDAEELMARIERHVQRQHCIKLDMESALEKVKAMIARLGPQPADALATQPSAHRIASSVSRAGLNVVAETDFEEQMSDLCDENAKLSARLHDVERMLEVKTLHTKRLEERIARLAGTSRSSFEVSGLTNFPDSSRHYASER